MNNNCSSSSWSPAVIRPATRYWSTSNILIINIGFFLFFLYGLADIPESVGHETGKRVGREAEKRAETGPESGPFGAQDLLAVPQRRVDVVGQFAVGRQHTGQRQRVQRTVRLAERDADPQHPRRRARRTLAANILRGFHRRRWRWRRRQRQHRRKPATGKGGTSEEGRRDGGRIEGRLGKEQMGQDDPRRWIHFQRHGAGRRRR